MLGKTLHARVETAARGAFDWSILTDQLVAHGQDPKTATKDAGAPEAYTRQLVWRAGV